MGLLLRAGAPLTAHRSPCLRFCIWEARIPFELGADFSTALGMGVHGHQTWSPGVPDSPCVLEVNSLPLFCVWGGGVRGHLRSLTPHTPSLVLRGVAAPGFKSWVPVNSGE